MNKELFTFAISILSYSILVLLILFTPLIAVTGWKLIFLVGFFIIAMPILIYSLDLEDWKPVFWFSFLASLFQIFPDWFLAEALGVLVFPDEERFLIGKVPIYMAGMWTIPFFISLLSARIAKSNINFIPVNIHILTGLIALMIFWISEETMHHIPVWYAQNVKLIGSSAIYVLPAEFLLGVYLSWVYEISLGRNILEKILLASSVFIFYTGALSVSYLIVEKLS
ncbi:MAG: hypothetical protein JJT78_00565 [Leptospira sp.]|nr:hypothetical protein [Leptospira sp.]